MKVKSIEGDPVVKADKLKFDSPYATEILVTNVMLFLNCQTILGGQLPG